MATVTRSVPGSPVPFPHAWLERLRDSDPVHHDPAWGGWIVSSYADVSTLLSDSRLSLEGGAQAMFERLDPSVRKRLMPLERHVSKWLGVLDPVNHRRLRTILAKAFAPDVISATQSLVRRMAATLLDAIDQPASADFLEAFARPLPAMVIARILGTPEADSGLVLEWSTALTRFVGEGFQNADAMFEGQKAVLDMTGYLKGVVRRYGTAIDPADATLIARLLRAHYDDGITQMDEILANCVLLLFAGHETTTLAISNTLLLLLADRQSLERYTAGRAALNAAIEESFRCLSPVQMVRRQAVADFSLRGHHIAKGEMVWLAIGAANRDPLQYPDAASFVPGRKIARNLAFGAGPHFCLGAALSSMETEIALAECLRRFPQMSLSSAQPIEWHPNPTACALRSLPVSPRGN
jgi:cytochrome P450